MGAKGHVGEIERGLIPDTLRTSDWLKYWWHPYMAAITEEDEFWYSKCLIAEMIRSGTTCFVEPGCMWLDRPSTPLQTPAYAQRPAAGCGITPDPMVTNVPNTSRR